ncbi:Glycosyl transferase group 1 [Acidobacteriia bacterium SbA2]|nr:Glycosyl transferase group 1 [Acidobacteriia bacterium SbA2]
MSLHRGRSNASSTFLRTTVFRMKIGTKQDATRTNFPAARVARPWVSPNPGFSTLKVALVHDWLTGMRGGEKALETLCSLFPDAPLWTLVHVPGSVSKTIEARKIHTSFLQHLPFAKTKYRHYLPLFPMAAELTKVSAKDADVVISTSHAVAKAMVKKHAQGGPLHVCYIHTPMRYIWDRFDDYFGPEKVGRVASHLFFKPIAKLLQVYDLKTVNRVDVYCTNSHYVAERIRRIYHRDAEVIYGPGDVGVGASVVRRPEDWYLMVTAMVPYKRVDQAIVACSRLGRRLKIVGKGPEERRLKSLARETGASVEFLGFISDEELLACYGRAKGLLFPGVEDFGLVPVEAIAAGCPLIALAKGGAVDSMTSETAEFYEEESAEALQQAIVRFEAREFCDAELRRRAAEFTREQFSRRFAAVLQRALATRWEPQAACA